MKEYNTKSKKERAIFRNLYREYTKELSQYSQRLKDSPLTEKDIQDLNTNSLLKRYFITDETNSPIGFCLLGFGENTQPETDWYIAEFFIKEEYRRKGYGEDAVQEILQSHPGKYCYFVLKNNQKANAFWNTMKIKFNCKDITNKYDAEPYTPDDCIFYAFEK